MATGKKPRIRSVIETPAAASPMSPPLPTALASMAGADPVAVSALATALDPAAVGTPVVHVPEVSAPVVEPAPADPVSADSTPVVIEKVTAPSLNADATDVVIEPIELASLDSAKIPPVAVAPASDPEPATKPETANLKETPMNETYTTAADAMKNGAEAMKTSMHTTTENAMAQGKASFEQVATKSREAIETGMKHVDEMAGMARGNVEAMLASSRAATQGIEAIAREVADFSRKSFEETTAAARAMTTVKTPNELMALQNDFAKTQFDAAVAEMSKLSETMVKLMGEVFEPMQARATIAADSMKSMVGKVGL